ncbi:MAG: hypothetical protein HY808_06550 [Nitrospirae bacterium]|nr:hypothetical protein [Nitrospirota bacterium]
MKMKKSRSENIIPVIVLTALSLLLLMSAAGAEVHIVKIKDFNFHPAELMIKQGDTVLWINEMPYGHWVISGADIRHDNRFFSPLLLNGHKFENTFKEPVVQDYYCPIHSMQGRITVLGAGKEKTEEATSEKKKRRRTTE